MGLEAGVTYIEDLVATNPVGATDNVDEGDDHIRNIKTAVQGSFPSLGAAAVTATAAEVNYVDVVAAGTAEASKALILGSSKDIDTIVLGSPTINGDVSAGDAVLDEDDMASDSATKVPTQQSVKAYADNVIQAIEATDATYVSTALVIAYDDTIPTVSEGLELLTQAITPKYSTSKIEISFDIPIYMVSSAIVTITIVDKTGATVLKTCGETPQNSTINTAVGSVLVASPGTSANTYSLRIGVTSSTVYMNGNGSARRYGGSSAIRLTVKEIA